MCDVERTGAIILAGGQSRRMGAPKAWLKCGDEYLLQRVARLTAEVLSPIVVACKPSMDMPPLPPEVGITEDWKGDEGPLAGIVAGMDSLKCSSSAAFVVACDHALLKPAFIRDLVGFLPGHHAVVPERDNHIHPTCAVYKLETARILKEMRAAEDLRATSFARKCNPRIVTASDFADSDPKLESIENCNDRDSFDRMIRRIQQG